MKAFLQNLLIIFALSLCALISFQWVRETDLRKQVQALTDTVHDKLENIQSLQSSVKHDEGEIVRLDGLKTMLTQTVQSNDLPLGPLHVISGFLDRLHQGGDLQIVRLDRLG